MKVMNKKIASLAMAAVMTAGGIGVAKLIAANSVTASADTGIVSVADTGSIGIGETNKATVNVSVDNPAKLTLNNVTAGQYYLMAKVANVSPDDWVDLSAEIGENYAYLSYNAYANAYIALVTVEANSEIVLSTYMGDYTVDVYLGGLFMGASTDNSIYGLQIADGMSKTLELENVAAGEYYINIQLEYGSRLEAGAKLYAQLDNGAKIELVYNSNMYGYTAKTAINGATSLTVSTDNEEKVNVNVSLYAVVSVNTPLPMTKAATFTQYEAQGFYYTADKTGYFTIKANSTTENAEFSITLKTNPNDLVSTIIPDSSFPMYFVAGNTYYFDITYSGLTDTWDAPATVEATFSFEEWKTPTVALNEMVYVPVTMATDTKTVPVGINGEVGTKYIIGLSNVPFEVEKVIAHYAGEEIALNGFDGFNGEITIKEGYETIYFTSEYNAEFVSGVTLSYVPVEYDDTIKLDTVKEITLRAGETLMFYVFDLPAGEYMITIDGDDEFISVADAYDYTIVRQGAGIGFFDVFVWEEGGTATAYLYFTNHGTATVTFKATVS